MHELSQDPKGSTGYKEYVSSNKRVSINNSKNQFQKVRMENKGLKSNLQKGLNFLVNQKLNVGCSMIQLLL